MTRALFAFVALLTLASAAPTSAATFTPKAGGVSLDMTGEITPGDAWRLSEAVQQQRRERIVVERVFLDSPGGDVVAGVELASRVATLRMDTVVRAKTECASMCFIVFALSNHRVIFPTSKIGVHSIRDSFSNEENGQAMASTMALARLLQQHGVPERIISKMVMTPPESIAWLSRTDLGDWVEVLSDKAEIPGADEASWPSIEKVVAFIERWIANAADSFSPKQGNQPTLIAIAILAGTVFACAWGISLLKWRLRPAFSVYESVLADVVSSFARSLTAGFCASILYAYASVMGVWAGVRLYLAWAPIIDLEVAYVGYAVILGGWALLLTSIVLTTSALLLLTRRILYAILAAAYRLRFERTKIALLAVGALSACAAAILVLTPPFIASDRSPSIVGYIGILCVISLALFAWVHSRYRLAHNRRVPVFDHDVGAALHQLGELQQFRRREALLP